MLGTIVPFCALNAQGVGRAIAWRPATMVASQMRRKQGWNDVGRLTDYDASDMREKLLSLPDLLAVLAIRRARRDRIVLTNGCFDLLHIGHVRYLQQARTLGDLLVVGVNADNSVRSFKSPERPLVPELERAEVVAALESVDYVVLFSEPTAERLVTEIRPDVYVKGGDYREEDLPEAPTVRIFGGRVQVLDLVPGRSTSELIQKIRSLP